MPAQQAGAAREGQALLQGIVLCAVCGRGMTVHYVSQQRPTYICKSRISNRACQAIHAPSVDGEVESAILQALSREELALAIGAVEKLEERVRDVDRQWQKRMEAARYEAEKAARRYHQVEPENRLVARTLESEWNSRLAEVDRLEREYQEVKSKPPFTLTAEDREKILALARDLPRMWRAPTTKSSQRMQIVRLLVEDVTLRKREEPHPTEVAIRWKTGTVTRHEAPRPVRWAHTTAEDVVARIQALYATTKDAGIADILNHEGLRTGYGGAFTATKVQRIRIRRGMHKYRQ